MSLASVERPDRAVESRRKKPAEAGRPLAYQEYPVNAQATWGTSVQNRLSLVGNVLSHTLFHNTVEFLGNDSIWNSYKQELSKSMSGLSGFDLKTEIIREYYRIAAILGIPMKSIETVSADQFAEEKLRVLIHVRIQAEHEAHRTDWDALLNAIARLEATKESVTSSSRNLVGHVVGGGNREYKALSGVTEEMGLLDRRVNGVRNPQTRNIEGGIFSRMQEVQAIAAKDTIFPEDIERIARLIADTRADIAAVRTRFSVNEERRVSTLLKTEKGTLKKETAAAYKTARAAMLPASKILTEMDAVIAKCTRRATRFTALNKAQEDASAIMSVSQEVEQVIDRQMAKLHRGYQGIDYRNGAHKRKTYSRGQEFAVALHDFKQKLPALRQNAERFSSLFEQNAG